MIYRASTTAPVNIAVIKYWGKRDVALNLPTNSSISVTLAQDDLRAWTTAACSSTFSSDRMWLNGQERETHSDKRLQACLSALRNLRRALESEDAEAPKMSEMPLHIASENNFPTAAGLASSAAGFAALVRAVADLYQLPTSPADLSRIARQGSGSACRSLFGGYVAWDMGTKEDGSDSQAYQVATSEHWPTMRACILVASAQKKDVSSTSGMQSTTTSSTLFPQRVSQVVPSRMSDMTKAIEDKDFAKFAELTMRDSNQFHAVCMDTYPPIFYMNDTSRAAIKLVEHINAEKVVCAYTFDAGPNAVIYYLEESEELVLSHVKSAVGDLIDTSYQPKPVPSTIKDALKAGITRVILTKIGPGPQSTERALLSESGELV